MVPSILISILLFVILITLFRKLQALRADHTGTLKELDEIKTRFAPIIDVKAERASIQMEISRIQAEHEEALRELGERQRAGESDLAATIERIATLKHELDALEEEANLISLGFYAAHYDFASSELYQQRLDEIREHQKAMLKAETAAISAVEWTVNGSAAQGRKQIKQTLKLVLRAFNGECDASIAKVKFNNVTVMETRIRKAREAIMSLVQTQGCQITQEYLDLKLEELYLVYEYQQKLQEEKEEQRRIKEQMREEEKAQRELDKAQQDAEREESRYQDALAKARQDAEQAVGAQQDALLQQIEALQRSLEAAKENKERTLARAQMTRSGHVYVISNIGSFGEHVYKIGMTRRLDPMDRVKELGDASVPFDFDVHAIIYTEDAPALEAALHRVFTARRVNRVNEKKEFFRVPIEEIGEAVRNYHGDIELTKLAEARDYRRTIAIIEQEKLESGVAALTVSGIG